MQLQPTLPFIYLLASGFSILELRTLTNIISDEEIDAILGPYDK